MNKSFLLASVVIVPWVPAAWQLSAAADDVAAAEAEEVEGVTVTGSRIVRDGADAPTPLTVLGADILQDRFPDTIGEAIANLPAFKGVQNASTAQGNLAGAGGQTFLNARGLGTSRTLVLLDGARVVKTTPDGLIDVSLFPMGLVNRMEVVTGGGSAAYGSDALAGVVNVILDDDFTGLKGFTEGGISSRGDSESVSTSVTWGHRISDRLHILADAEYYESEGLAGATREFASYPTGIVSNPDYTPTNGQRSLIYAPYVYYNSGTFGGLITGGPLSNTQFLPGGETAPFTPCPLQSAGYVCDGKRDDIGWLGSSQGLKSPVERGVGYVKANFELTPSVSISLDGLYGKSSTSTDTPPPVTAVQGLIRINRDHAYLPAAVAAQMDAAGITSFNLARYSSDIGGHSTSYRDNELKRVKAGLDADAGGWEINSFLTYGESTNEIAMRDMPVRDRFNKATSSVMVNGVPTCTVNAPGAPAAGADPNCVPLNLFGVGAPSQAATDYVLGDAHAHFKSTQLAAGASVSRDLFENWAGTVKMAAGAEYRREDIKGSNDPISAANGFAFNNPQVFSGDENVKEGFGELLIPLARDVLLARNLELNLAGRVTEYSSVGTIEAWKFATNYEPVSGVRFRALASRDIRAPNLGELFTPLTQTAAAGSAVDPVTGLPAIFPTFRGGNQNLEAELADTRTIGIVLQPDFLPNLTVSVDYYRISIDGAIVAPNAQQVLNACAAGNSAVCALVERDASGTITRVNTLFANLNTLETNGFDFEVLYDMDLSGLYDKLGNLRLRGLANYQLHYEQTSNQSTVDFGGQHDFPDWTADVGAIYSQGRTTVEINGQYRGGGKVSVLNTNLQNNHVDSRFYLNLSASHMFTIGESTDVTAYLAVENVLDTFPPFPAGVGDPVGMAYKAGFRFSY